LFAPTAVAFDAFAARLFRTLVFNIAAVHVSGLRVPFRQSRIKQINNREICVARSRVKCFGCCSRMWRQIALQQKTTCRVLGQSFAIIYEKKNKTKQVTA
jgi:hypothetical protein